MKCTLEACPVGFKNCCISCEEKEFCIDKRPSCEDITSCEYQIKPRHTVRKKTSYRWLVDVMVIALLILIAVWTSNLNMMAEDTLNTLADTQLKIDDLETNVRVMDKQVETEIKNGAQKQDSLTGTYLGEYTITYYCPCIKCCGKTDGITKSGTQATEGRTVGADWSLLPSGTKLYIEGLGERIVEDSGSGLNGKHLDVFVDSHDKALELGRHTRKVYRVEL